MPSVRDMIDAHRSRIGKGNLQMGEAAELLTILSSLLGNVNKEVLTREMAYNHLLHETLKNDVSVASAKIVAKASPVYQQWREAVDYKENATEMCRSLKYYLKSLAEERQMGGGV